MKGILFDLDGTLVNTLEDIRAALNHVIGLCYAREITPDECRAVVGNGLRKALIGALWYSRSAYPEDELDILYAELIDYYSKHVCVHSKPYDGILDFLNEAKARGYRLGVLSNKADDLAREVIETLFPSGLFDFVRGLRPSDRPKPDNLSVNDFIDLCNGEKSDVTIIGDSEVDWLTASNAGCPSVIVIWGYRKREELEEKGIHPLASSLEEVKKILWN